MNQDFKENRKIIRRHIKSIRNSVEYQQGCRIDNGGYDDGSYQKEYNIYDHWITFLIIIHNTLLIEEKFQNEFEITGKEVNKYLKLPDTKDVNEILKVSQEYYNHDHKVRFGIETMDSIQEVRHHLKTLRDNGIDFHNKIYFSFKVSGPVAN